MGLLTNRVAIVAGVGPGLGAETAVAFAREGAAVVLMARRTEPLEEVRVRIESEGGRASIYNGDVTNPGACDSLVAHAIKHFGRLDVLVANAFTQGDQGPPTTTVLDDWRKVIEVNLLAPLSLAKAATPAMAAGGGGSVIMVASNQAWEVVPGFSAYSASKAALVNLTRHLAVELGPQKIRVNTVHPGLIMGDAVQAYINSLAQQQGADAENFYQSIANRAALHRIAGPDEMAGALVFFASDLSQAITGQSLCVDAGVHFH